METVTDNAEALVKLFLPVCLSPMKAAGQGDVDVALQGWYLWAHSILQNLNSNAVVGIN